MDDSQVDELMQSSFGISDEIIEPLGGIAKGIGATLKQIPQDMAKVAAAQVVSQQQTQSAVRQMYGIEESQPMETLATKPPNQQQTAVTQPQNILQTALGMSVGSEKKLTPEEQQKLSILRQRLHYEMYYKKIDQATSGQDGQQAESVQDKLEREDQEKKEKEWLDEQQKPKELPINMRPKGTGEIKGGVGG